MFFVSAIGIGLAMIILESSLSSRYFKRGLEMHLLEKLAAGHTHRAWPFTSSCKLGELAACRTIWRYLFTSGLMSVLFWAEILIGSVFPLVLFSLKRIRPELSERRY